MNNLEKKMITSLIDLKENHHVVGVKAEFEAEGTRLEEALRLKEIVTRAGLDLTIKIGGCEAIKDMLDARIIGVNTIVAPMIESAYALKKFVHSTKFVFPEEERPDVGFLLNLETITGYNNFDEMISSEDFNGVDGVVLGRVDMTGSMNMSREEINCERIFEIANIMAQKTFDSKKQFIIGGGVSVASLPFFKRLPKNSLDRFETRKIIFDAQGALVDPNADKGILKAVGFELMWLKNKREFYKMIFEEDSQRLTMLEARYKRLIEEAGGVYA